MVHIPFFDCFRAVFPTTLLALVCLLSSNLLADDKITAFVDSDGRVIFVNETPAVVSATNSNGSLRAGAAAALDGMIEQVAAEHQVDPELVRAVVRVESNYNPYAISPRGARGLMQLLPATAVRFGVQNSFDARANLDGGTRYLKYLMQQFNGDLRLTLAAYNAGENAVNRNGGVPPFRETREYLEKISRLFPLSASSSATTTAAGIMKFVDNKGVVHFSNTDGP
ncbi:MAG: lytic transglycosylase domain-containing protein [Acidobacteria bacterium]|nr:lytic transglycosylase domain-containing protein [Acidobacteriota bacterium]